MDLVRALLSLAALAIVLVVAVVRPGGLPEFVTAGPAAALLVAIGAVPLAAAWSELRTLAPTLGFLAAVLVLGRLAGAEGVFAWAGSVAARIARGRPTVLLAVVFVLAAIVTAVLSLDATVVLLTPVVLATAATARLPARPYTYATGHLANSASTLLPVSNLTNLLAFAACGLGFAAFTGLMAGPWLAAIAVEWLVFRRFFAADLAAPAPAGGAVPLGPDRPAPVFALVTLAATLAGFVVGEPLGVHPAWAAAAGAVVLGVRQVARSGWSRVGVSRTAATSVRGADPWFLAFVAALSVVVLAARRTSLDRLVAGLVPDHADLAGLAGIALLAAVLANVVNNLPATLILLPLADRSPGLVLAVLLGVNLGPNLTYAGSLATLLWRQVLRRDGDPPRAREFLALGALTVPAGLAAAVVALWAGLAVTGH